MDAIGVYDISILVPADMAIGATGSRSRRYGLRQFGNLVYLSAIDILPTLRTASSTLRSLGLRQLRNPI
jgi:hypothetical protein